MHPRLLPYLCDPIDQSDLALQVSKTDDQGRIIEGVFVSLSGHRYMIRDGVPRFEEVPDVVDPVLAFGDQWNFFNFDQFKLNWLDHTIKNTFGSISVFSGKMVVDAGAGSGMQSRWISEAGADHVIALELSHSVDGIMKSNLQHCASVDIVQCSIDRPPLREGAVRGIVICHNVIQHTPSVEGTARALWRVVGQGGEFVFNCYPKNDLGIIRKVRLSVYEGLRAVLSRCSFKVRLRYAQVMSVLRFVPILGWFCEKASLMVRGDVPRGKDYLVRCFKAGVLNTFDCYGAHTYQHLKTDAEILSLIAELQPNPERILNRELYFERPQPIGIALRLLR